MSTGSPIKIVFRRENARITPFGISGNGAEEWREPLR
jgi:hypothetical protein